MEDVLRLYARPFNARQPVVCLDERPVVLRGDVRVGQPAAPGRPARIDYEYERRGTANVFCIIEPKVGRRQTFATKNRKGPRYVGALKRIARRYSTAKTIHLVQDNLNLHCKRTVMRVLGRRAGEALWSRFTVHYTPMHGSWLNAAELEASLVSRECLGKRRIGSLAELKPTVGKWSRRADQERRAINWRFRVADARRVFRYDGIATSRSKH
jgi:hypothetical protein